MPAMMLGTNNKTMKTNRKSFAKEIIKRLIKWRLNAT